MEATFHVDVFGISCAAAQKEETIHAEKARMCSFSHLDCSPVNRMLTDPHSCPWKKKKHIAFGTIFHFSTTKHTAVMGVEERVFISKDFMQWCIQTWSPQTIKTCAPTYTLCCSGPCVQLLLLTHSCGTFFPPFFHRHPWCLSLSHLPPCYSSVKSAHWSSRSLWGNCRAQTFTTSMRPTLNKTGGYFQPEPHNSLFGAIQVIQMFLRATTRGAE